MLLGIEIAELQNPGLHRLDGEAVAAPGYGQAIGALREAGDHEHAVPVGENPCVGGRFQAADRDRILERLASPGLDKIAGFPVLDIDSIDGKRFHIEDGWVAVRFSGTEPLLRVYAEAQTPDMVNKLLDGTMEFLGV